MKATNNRPAAYIGTYKKYNEGSLYGAWLTLTDYNNFDAFINACKELHKDEESPELMCEDVENMPEGVLLPECFSKQDFDDVITAWKDQQEEETATAKAFQIVDYSDKAIAVIGDTKAVRDDLKKLGGKFNFRLSCGAGWIFSKKQRAAVESFLNGAAVVPSSDNSGSGQDYAKNLKEWADKYGDAYTMKRYCGAVRLFDDCVFLLRKGKINTDFWFHDEGPGYDFYEEVTRNDENKKKYFFAKNMQQVTDNVEYCIERGYGLSIVSKGCVLNFDTRNDQRPDPEYIEEIKKGIEWSKKEFEKRLNAYIKRWGVKKLRFDTYWADR